MPTNLWRSVNYKTPMRYFVNTYIREYDLSKANINALLYTGRITQEERDIYLAMDKMEREVKIGLWIKKDKSVYKDIQSGIIEAKRRLVRANDIEDLDVVSVKNDAMFIVGKELKETEFPPFKFSMKNVYTMYIQLCDLEVYYGDSVNPYHSTVDTNIDVKGISDELILLHQGGMLDLICDTCYKLQREDIRDIMRWIELIYQSYIRRELPKEYYRSFDSFSGYTIRTSYQTMSLGEIDDTMIQYIDINRNLLVLRDLMSIISDIYHRRNRYNR